MDLVPSIMLSASGVILAAVAFAHRGDPDWRKAIPLIMGMAIATVALGALSAVLFGLASPAS
jgi:uncharacterized membrane protein YfcA